VLTLVFLNKLIQVPNLSIIRDNIKLKQGCALATPGGPWRLTFALGLPENLRCFIQIICWAP